MTIELPIEIHTPVIYPGQHAFGLLSQQDKLSPDQIETCFKHGSVWLERVGKPVRIYDQYTPLKPGNKLHLYCNDSTLAACPYQPQLVQDFTGFSVWVKPSGMLSQGSKWGDHWTLSQWIQHHHFSERECFITHRLDRFTEGLMIVAHQSAINKQFHRLFEQRQIKKTYRAIVSGLMTPDESINIDTPIEQQSAVTRILVISQNSATRQSLVEINPETGRKHQIRIHLAELGHPIVNDRQYGLAPFSGDMQLQACGLEFTPPDQENLLQIRLQEDKLLALTTQESS